MPVKNAKLGIHSHSQKKEQVHYVSNYNRQNNPYSVTFNPGWKNHPNLSWNSQNVMKPPPRFSPLDNKSSPEEALIQLAKYTNKFMTETKTNIQNQVAVTHNLETQVGEMANILLERQQDNLPSNTELNPKKHCNAIILRNEKELDSLLKSKKSEKEDKEVNFSPPRPIIEQTKDLTKGQLVLPKNPSLVKVSFHQRLQKINMDRKFLDVFKKLHINIPFADALSQMPSYEKFMKWVLSNKKKLKDYEMVTLNEELPPN